MVKQIVKLSRSPFYVSLVDRPIRLFVDPPTGDILFDNAALHASRGLAFSLIPEPTGHLLRLQYCDINIDVGSTDDAEAAASWVEAVNAFLATKRAAEPNRNGSHAVDANVIAASGVDHGI